MNTIAFFDFDGTITTKDSFGDFIKYAVGKPRYFIGLILKSPILVAYKLKLLPNYLAKEKLFTHFFKDWQASVFQEIADKYSSKCINKITRPKAIEKIKWHQQQGHTVVIVSASFENWLKEWCINYDLDLIATKLEIQDGKITGRFATKNCYSIEKVNRINEKYNLKNFSTIFAYGDSEGDKEMLSLAEERFYRYF